MKNIILAIFLIPSLTFAKIHIATTTADLAAIVQAVGADQVDVFSIGKGTQDPHTIEAKPSYMVKLRDTDVIFAQGLELESAWLGPLIRGARNPKLNAKDSVYELAKQLDPIEVHAADVSRAEGDVHPGGNPHFQLDPVRLGKAAKLIAARLSEMNPEQKSLFEKNAQNFVSQMDAKLKEWQARIKKTGIKEVVTYHKTFSYFCDRFEIRCEVQLEPKPGIPPTASHLISVIDQMKKRDIRLVLIENLYNDDMKDKIKHDVPKAIVDRVAVSVGGDQNSQTNEKLIENIVKTFESAAK